MHIGLIMDGNRRWAKNLGKNKFFGHKKGVENLEMFTEICADDPEIKILTVYTLSTENMNREQKELDNLFALLEKFAKKWKKFVKNGIRVKIFGDVSKLPKSCQKALKELEEKTKNGEKLIFCPAINYGGRDEIIRAVNKLFKKIPQKITEKDLEKFLDTEDLPAINLVIRTGGKKRLSNFMLWQSAYAELYFLDKMWPEFTEKDLQEAIFYYKSVQRNFGK